MTFEKLQKLTRGATPKYLQEILFPTDGICADHQVFSHYTGLSK